MESLQGQEDGEKTGRKVKLASRRRRRHNAQPQGDQVTYIFLHIVWRIQR